MIASLIATPLSYGQFMALQGKPVKKGQLLAIKIIVILTIVFISFIISCNPIPA